MEMGEGGTRAPRVGAGELYHVTLTTGRVGRTHRGDVDRTTLATLRPLVEGLTGGDPAVPHTRAIPLVTGFLIQCVMLHGRDAPLFRVYAHPEGPIPIEGVDAVLAPQTDASRPPAARPWCGVILHRGVLGRPDAMGWLGDFERCIAWAVWAMRWGTA